jgi:phosphoglycolate phosphatase
MNFGQQGKHPGRIGIKIKAFLFDLDGTLVNSESQIFSAVEQTRLELIGLPASKEFVSSKIGLPARELFRDLDLSEADLVHAVEIFRSKLSMIKLSPRELFQGVSEFLVTIKTLEKFLAVATNKPIKLANQALEDTGIAHHFDYVIGAGSTPPKPDPSIILACLEYLCVEPSEAVMFGDRTEDMQAATKAGVFSIGVTQGPHDTEMLINAGANICFKNFSEIERALMKGQIFENLQ